MTLAGEAIIIWTATGLSVVAMKAEKMGKSVPHWLPRVTFVHNTYRLVSIPSTLCSRFISMKEYDVETFHSLCHRSLACMHVFLETGIYTL